MAKFNYAALKKNTVVPLLERFGMPVNLNRITNNGYDTATGAVSQSEEVIPTTGVILDITDGTQEFSVVESGDRKLLSADAPAVSDTIDYVDGITYRVKEVITIAPGGVDVLFKSRVGK